MKNKKKMIFVGIALILLVIVGVVAVNISKKASQREEIARQLELGKKQLTSLEYEEAIATFKNALAIYPKDQELLAGLVEAEEAYANTPQAQKRISRQQSRGNRKQMCVPMP